ncbi:BAG domain-containing protein [Xylogone sp. PMI_703]|nr:BAG domain-containing protein [Xylogone sp. PMI_703]
MIPRVIPYFRTIPSQSSLRTKSGKVASSAVASKGATLSSITEHLPDSLQSYVETAAVQINKAYLQLPLSIQKYLSSAATYTQLDILSPPALLGTLLIIAATVSMSRWGSSIWGRNSTRISPISSSRYETSVPITDEDFSYITSQDLQEPRRAYDPRSRPIYTPSSVEDDLLLIKHKGVTYPIRFPAYSIGEGKLQVRDVKERVAAFLDLPSGTKMRLVYKGQILKDDYAPCRDYNLKNQSEILCTVTEVPMINGNDSDDQSEDIQQEEQTKKKRSRKSKKSGKKKGAGSSFPGTPQTSTPSSAVPNTAIDKLEAIASHFRDKVLPLCNKYIESPPTDEKKKEFEHAKLGEIIMNDVLLKLDAVVTDGDDLARQRRRELVKETQAVLNELDTAREQ